MRIHLWPLIGLLALAACDSAHDEPLPRLSDQAPRDRQVQVDHDVQSQLERLSELSRAELPEVRDRFLRGLPADHHLYVTTRLRDARTEEIVFVHVRAWDDPERIDGVLDSDVVVSGYHRGQPLDVRTADVFDWTISRPDGTEEGNRVGRYLDEHQ